MKQTNNSLPPKNQVIEVKGRRGRQKGRGNGVRKSHRGVDVVTAHYMCVWKCHYETLYYITVQANNKKLPFKKFSFLI
jgi:hypothetical protein